MPAKEDRTGTLSPLCAHSPSTASAPGDGSGPSVTPDPAATCGGCVARAPAAEIIRPHEQVRAAIGIGFGRPFSNPDAGMHPRSRPPCPNLSTARLSNLYPVSAGACPPGRTPAGGRLSRRLLSYPGIPWDWPGIGSAIAAGCNFSFSRPGGSLGSPRAEPRARTPTRPRPPLCPAERPAGHTTRSTHRTTPRLRPAGQQS